MRTFVLDASSAAIPIETEGTTFIFVTHGIEAALEQASRQGSRREDW